MHKSKVSLRPNTSPADNLENSQRAAIRSHLKAGHSIDPMQALRKFGCLRLSGRIFELKHDENLDIEMTLVKDPKSGKRYARYSLRQKRQRTKRAA